MWLQVQPHALPRGQQAPCEQTVRLRGQRVEAPQPNTTGVSSGTDMPLTTGQRGPSEEDGRGGRRSLTPGRPCTPRGGQARKAGRAGAGHHVGREGGVAASGCGFPSGVMNVLESEVRAHSPSLVLGFTFQFVTCGQPCPENTTWETPEISSSQALNCTLSSRWSPTPTRGEGQAAGVQLAPGPPPQEGASEAGPGSQDRPPGGRSPPGTPPPEAGPWDPQPLQPECANPGHSPTK